MKSNKSKFKILVIIVGIVGFLSVGSFILNCNRLYNDKEPVLTIKSSKSSDYDFWYYGLGYKVFYRPNSFGGIVFFWEALEDVYDGNAKYIYVINLK